MSRQVASVRPDRSTRHRLRAASEHLVPAGVPAVVQHNPAEQAEVNMDEAAALELIEQVLAVGLNVLQRTLVETSGVDRTDPVG